MSPPFLKRTTGWLPAAVVLAVVLITGSRLIMLSVQQHAETAREASRAEATRAALSIESQLQVVDGCCKPPGCPRGCGDFGRRCRKVARRCCADS